MNRKAFWAGVASWVFISALGQLLIVFVYLHTKRDDRGMILHSRPWEFLWGSSAGLWIAALIYAPLLGWLCGQIFPSRK